MNIAQALKLKNRLAGKLAKLEKQINTYNRTEEGSDVEYCSIELLESWKQTKAVMTDLKIKIAKANAGIADKLVRLSEAKSALTFYSTRFTNHGPKSAIVEKREYRSRLSDPPAATSVKMISNITTIQVDTMQAAAQHSIDTLQDEIDNYNATTQI